MPRRRDSFLVAALLLAGCASSETVTPGQAPTPYEGPLVISTQQAQTAVEKTAGAAGRAVQCRAPADGRINDANDYVGEIGSTPIDGLQGALRDNMLGLPDDGWQLDVERNDRTLFSIQVDGVRKAAAVLVEGKVLGKTPGWWVETFAHCNLAEFPPPVAARLGIELWRDRAGSPVDTRTVVSRPGPGHCDWTSMTFLNLGPTTTAKGDRHTYLRNVDPRFVGSYVAEPYREAVARPPDAVDTGYRRDGKVLWLSVDAERAYVGSPDATTVELWPRSTKPLACA